MSSRIDFKTLWPRNGHADSLGVKSKISFELEKAAFALPHPNIPIFPNHSASDPNLTVVKKSSSAEHQSNKTVNPPKPDLSRSKAKSESRERSLVL